MKTIILLMSASLLFAWSPALATATNLSLANVIRNRSFETPEVLTDQLKPFTDVTMARE